MARDLIVDAAVRSTALLLLAALVAAIARRGSAAFRHRVWASALLGLIAVPVASALDPAWPLPILPAPKREPMSILPTAPGPIRPSVLPDLLPEPERVVFREAQPMPAERASPESPPLASRLPDAWTLAYSGGALATALPVLAGLAINARRRRRSRPVADWADLVAELRATFAIRRRVDVRMGEDATIPATWGVLRPVVILPAEAATWPEPTRRAVLAHEMAHVRRLDWPVHLIARLTARPDGHGRLRGPVLDPHAVSSGSDRVRGRRPQARRIPAPRRRTPLPRRPEGDRSAQRDPPAGRDASL
ncbi:M56 family metallopeptidase [Paludisphaera soli]|uniref:M56 family metallopeptidase n=1 Tax=Paludisphaera soli TaxID=2712865 RepID=UPI0013EDB588|nr:M56 family metallopeptidase [Paludisphaera soli]